MADDKPHSFETGDSFVKVSGPFLMDRTLTDQEKVYLIALESWAWEKDHCWPGNKEIARRCGWLLESGKPAKDKAQRIGQQLEAKGRIRRVVSVVDGEHRRDRIVLVGTRPDHKLNGTAEMPYGTANPPHPTANSPHGYPKDAVPVRQNRGRGTADVPSELESDKDSPKQTQARRRIIKRSPTSKKPKPLGPDQIKELNRLLSPLQPGTPKTDAPNAVIADLGRWLVANRGGDFNSYLKELWSYQQGEITIEALVGGWGLTVQPGKA